MTQQYLQQQVPSVRYFMDEDGFDGMGSGGSKGESTPIPYIDVFEVTPETQSRMAKHEGEDGTVYADTRIIQPARYRVVIGITAQDGNLADAHKNLLDASFSPASKYTVTSYFSRCWNMAVVSSKHRDTPDMQGLRVQEVVFEECLEYEKTGFKLSDVEKAENSSAKTQSAQLITE